ncbi:ABC transporter substrate-binding protein [Caballeronia sp. LP006]|uniref:ABC transporter substrate-binding protein n=1 Tax=Caballeronia sp. LP006 TaxID=3038552 RepID=UPI002866B76C|nr:ABC transporter substrate-binding protein [Caballeronia sp. LP006]MDR5826921.1 ABC transporter substrate-binding protein [Caballeronia sp. LP006]
MKVIARLALGLFALTASLVAGLTHAQSADPKDIVLRVSSWGGKSTQTQIKYAGDIFTNKTGVKVQFIDGASIDHVAKLVAANGRNVPYDVVLLDGDVRAQAIKAGVLQKLDPAKVPNVNFALDLAKNAQGYAPDFDFVSAIFVYNADKFQQAGIPAPSSWKDLWNPKLAGHVALPDLANGAGRALLIETSRLNGGDEGNLDKAVAEIAKINARTFWQTSQQAEQLIKSGDIWLTVIADGRAYALQDAYKPARAVRPTEGSIAFASTADIVKGTPHPELAAQFLNEIYGALYQLGNATDFYYGPTNRLLAPVIEADPQLAAKLIYKPEQAQALYHPDWNKFWGAFDRAQDSWNRTIVSRK